MTEPEEEPTRPTEVLIDLSINGGTLVLSEDDAFINVDEKPEEPTADDVINAMKQDGSKRTVISDWDLLDWDDVTISVQVRRWVKDDKGVQRLVVTHGEW